ncbi:MTBP_C domain-containing protein [Trichonephila inaurata madagascariensis]|uniref:MTBP_C domain-containing protein n=1 Tax=Trichonephila inaurata madagascariensis TaxID=2747483 RepID=A0A8X6XS28_9ARAC|nr:MTBP_C domain-containing protein [Trichonephila inaurata madagascariensis]
MEHYFLYICNGIPTTEEKHLVVKYIQTLLPQPEEEENVEWKEKNSEVNIKIEDTSQILSSHVHYLADQLPSCGSHKLDVILNHDILTSLSSNEEDIELTSALYRLFRWHGAHTTIVQPDKINNSNFKKWSEILDTEFLSNKIDPSLSAAVWRGSLQLSHLRETQTNSYPGFQLRLDVFENEILLDKSISSDNETMFDENLILSPILSMIDECNFSSIPFYLLLPVSFRLSITEPNMFNENSRKLLENLRIKSGAALILRMGYSTVLNKPKSDASLSTTKWEKMISSRNIKFPDICLPCVDKYITLAVTRSSKSDNIIAYPFRDLSNINAELNFFITDALISKQVSTSFGDDCEKENYTDIELPYLSKTLFHNLMNKMNIVKKNMEKYSGEFNLSDEFLELLKEATKHSDNFSLFINIDSYKLFCDEIDPADWPERVHLLQKQFQIDEDKKNILPNFLHNLSPQLTEKNVFFSIEDITKSFESSGEAKDSTQAHSISQNNKLNHINTTHKKVLQSRWPDVMKCAYHDMYYNIDKQAAEKEAVGNNMIRIYVQNESATTCNNQQLNPNSSIVVKTKVQAQRQKWRSPSKLKLSPQKSLNLVYKTYMSSMLQSSKSKNVNKIDLSVKKTSNKIQKKKSALPVRCSPRKKKNVVYSKPGSSRQPPQASNQKQSNSTQLAEILKKKLRVAIASALEKNGINMDHTFFRPCFRKLFTVCQAFVEDIPCKKGSTSERMQKIADAHVKQVIEFEKQKRGI